MKPIYFSILLISLVTPSSRAQAPSYAVYKINPAQSRIALIVFSEGLLKALGHNHTIRAKSFSGKVQFDSENMEASSVSVSLDAGSLIVLDDPDLAEKDRNEVQATMQGVKVLNIKAFPQIVFDSTHIDHAGKTGEDFTVTGKLTLHGVEREISLPVRVHSESNLLRATGVVTLVQSNFGIKPIRSGLGTLRVKDQVELSFDIAAERVVP